MTARHTIRVDDAKWQAVAAKANDAQRTVTSIVIDAFDAYLAGDAIDVLDHLRATGQICDPCEDAIDVGELATDMAESGQSVTALLRRGLDVPVTPTSTCDGDHSRLRAKFTEMHAEIITLQRENDRLRAIEGKYADLVASDYTGPGTQPAARIEGAYMKDDEWIDPNL